MSFASLLDTTVTVWRRTSTPGTLREEVVDYVEVNPGQATPNAIVNRPRAPIADVGPGLDPTGERVIYMETAADVEERDVLELIAGPDAPSRWEVDGPVTRPRGHHAELRCRHFSGLLPSDS